MTNKTQYINKTVFLKLSPSVASLLLLFFILLSLWMIFEYAEKERQRDLLGWQSRLALLAEIRATTIEDWIEKRKNQLHKLANNASLKLFLSEYKNKEAENEAILNVQQGHVRNLLRATAERFGFAEDNDGQSHLNVNRMSDYGLAVLGAEQQLIMSTKGFPKNLQHNIDLIKKVYSTARVQIIDLYEGQHQQPVYGYLIPVFAIQDIDMRAPVGAVMLLLNPQKNLYSILKNKQSVTTSDESLLVKKANSSLIYISPVKGEFKLFHQMPVDNKQLAAAYALNNPGGFAQMIDYVGKPVLVTGRKIKHSPWTLVQKISAEEALLESNKHQKFLLTTFTLFVLMIAAAFIAIWRHSTSMRLQVLSHALESRTALLDAVTDNIQENIILLDKDARIEFINPAFARLLKLSAEEIKAKKISSVLGNETARLLMQNADDQNHARVMTLILEGVERIYHITSTRLLSGEHRNDILFVLHDISELKEEQEKREQLGKGIIATLVKAVDLHDPHCANHSARTRDVAMEIATEMDLNRERMESLEMASLLANIGKLFVPKEILTKMQALSTEESAQLKRHIEFAIDILGELSFNGPVIDIISQKSERLDGSGYPRGLASDEIMLESRILAVADAFVAMASSRAYRQGRAVEDVVNTLLKQSETKYDRHVVAALFHISENKADWKTWQSI